jgi:ureidoacrylate peracid hydrolase
VADELIQRQWEVVETFIRNEGRPERVAKISKNRTAMIVIDMQNRFVRAGASIEVQGAREVVPNINTLTRACRIVGIPVIWVAGKDNRSPKELGLITTFQPRSPIDRHRPTPAEEALDADSIKIWPELEVDREKDYEIAKCRYSPFAPGASRLERLLRALDMDTLIMTGVATNVCAGLAAMEAMMLDFKVAYVRDATSAYTEFLQQAFLMNLKLVFADVVTTDEILNEIKQLG